MESEELHKRAHDLTTKFDYSLTSLCFAILGLSYQLSPNYGTTWPLTLLASWICFLVACGTGGWRLMWEPIFFRTNALQIEIDTRIKTIQAYSGMPIFDAAKPNLPLTQEQLRTRLAEDEKNHAMLTAQLEALNQKFPRMFKIQMGAFIMGVTLNSAFVAVNYCAKCANATCL